MRFGLGCWPNPQGHRAGIPFRLHAAMNVAAEAPADCDWRDVAGMVPPPKDQGRSSACTGHGTSGAVEMRCATLGKSLGFAPSERGIYGNGRAVERASRYPWGAPLPPLRDEGAILADVMHGITQFGIRARAIAQTIDGRNSDCEPATVNDDATLAELEKDSLRLVTGEHAIDPHASDLELQVTRALAAGIPLCVAEYVDTAFENWTPNQGAIGPSDPRDPDGGGHCMYIVGYRPRPFGREYIYRNSWGTGQGDGGDWIVTPDRLRAAWNIYVMDVRVT